MNTNQNTSVIRLTALGEVKVAKDERSYYSATFQDPLNPFAKTVTRNFWQQKNQAGEPVWKGADPAQVKPFVGKTIPGYIASRTVEPYAITGSDGVERTATIYTTVVFNTEVESAVFRSLQHPLAETIIVAAAPVEAVVEAAEDVVIA